MTDFQKAYQETLDELQKQSSNAFRFPFTGKKHDDGRYYTLGSDELLNSDCYYRYGDGKNWNGFNREELEYLSTKYCESIPSFDFSSNCFNNEVVAPISIQWSLDIAAKMPFVSLQELFDRAERIRKECERK